jgi:NAD+ diphosphatase
MSALESFPLGQPGFVNNILDRAAHLRNNDEKLMAMESDPRSRAYVVHRDSLVVKKEGEATRALLTIDEALKCGANPGTIFLGLRDNAPVFGMGISGGAAEDLMTRNDVAVSELRGMAMQGAVPPGELASAPRLLRQLRPAHLDEGRRLEARMPELQGRAFPAH